jgi:hypothetical protein
MPYATRMIPKGIENPEDKLLMIKSDFRRMMAPSRIYTNAITN